MKLKIRNGTMAGHTASVWIDGELTKDVTAVTLDVSVDHVTTATITRLVTDLDIETDAIEQDDD